MTVFTIDGSTLTVNAADGSVVFELVSVDESRVTRWVMQPEELAPLLLDAFISQGTVPIRASDVSLWMALVDYIARVESLAAQDA